MMFSKHVQLTVRINIQKAINLVSVSYEKDNIFPTISKRNVEDNISHFFLNLSSARFHAGHLGGEQRDPSIRVLRESRAGKHSP